MWWLTGGTLVLGWWGWASLGVVLGGWRDWGEEVAGIDRMELVRGVGGPQGPRQG